MNRADIIKNVARKSKYTKTPLTVKQVEECLELFQEVVKTAVVSGEEVRMSDFLKIEIQEFKSRKIMNIKTKEYSYTRTLKIPKAKLSLNFINEVKKNLNEEKTDSNF